MYLVFHFNISFQFANNNGKIQLQLVNRVDQIHFQAVKKEN